MGLNDEGCDSSILKATLLEIGSLIVKVGSLRLCEIYSIDTFFYPLLGEESLLSFNVSYLLTQCFENLFFLTFAIYEKFHLNVIVIMLCNVYI